MSAPEGSQQVREHSRQQGLVSDPVCGMSVDPAAGGPRVDYEDETYFFCSERCAERFRADPEAFAGGNHHGDGHVDVRDQTPPMAAEAVEYTCPMHPEIRRPGPGACPICGMALEPVVAAAEGGQSEELRDMTRRFWISVILTAPLFVLVMGSHLFHGIDAAVPDRLGAWLQLIIATPVVLWAGWPFFVRGWVSVRTMKLNMFTLIAMGTGVAWGRPPRSPRWCCSGRCWSCARASGPPVRSGRCST